MEIYVESAPEAPRRQLVPPARKLPKCLFRQEPLEPIDVPICDEFTWDSPFSPAWLAARWPGRNLRFVRVGRALAPLAEVPIAQVPYMFLIAKYFDQDKIDHALEPVVGHRLVVALRDMEWLMTNYSKQYDSSYFLQRAPHPMDKHVPRTSLVNVYDTYNATLHMYRRRHFRTYKQGQRMYLWTGARFEETTVGQLLCLIWSIETGLVTFAARFQAHIKEHEQSATRENQADRERHRQMGLKRKRQELVERQARDVWVVELPLDSLARPDL